MIFFLICLTLIIICGKYIHDLHNFNHTATLINLQNPDSLNIQELIRERSPMIVHNLLGKYGELFSALCNTNSESIFFIM